MKTIILTITLILTISCTNPTSPEIDDTSQDTYEVDKPSPSPYQQLNGRYLHSTYSNWEGGLYERSEYSSIKFDTTAEITYIHCYWSYTLQLGWVNALKDSSKFVLNFKMVGSKMEFFSAYDGEVKFSYDFEYLANGNFIYNNDLYIKQ